MTLSIMTLSIMTLSTMTLSILTLSIMTLSIMTLSIKRHSAKALSVIILNVVMLSVAFSNYAECGYAECHNAEWRYAGCRGAIIAGLPGTQHLTLAGCVGHFPERIVPEEQSVVSLQVPPAAAHSGSWKTPGMQKIILFNSMLFTSTISSILPCC
jgi:hypothetical protein